MSVKIVKEIMVCLEPRILITLVRDEAGPKSITLLPESTLSSAQ